MSQFTLYGYLKGNKPDFHRAMGPDAAREAFHGFVDAVKAAYVPERVSQGEFGAMMEVSLVSPLSSDRDH